MLPKRSRVPSKELKDLRGFMKRNSQSFVLRFRPNGLSGARFAVTVSAKSAPLSSDRHALKRRAAGFLATHSFPPVDLVITLTPSAATLPKKRFLQELAEVAKQVQL